MRARLHLPGILIGVCVLLWACSPSPEELEATQLADDKSATQTAEAALPTPTSSPTLTATPTLTPTQTPTPTITPTITPISTAELPSLPIGFRYHTTGGISIALPQIWFAEDIGHDGFYWVWQRLAAIDSQWSRSMTEIFSSEIMQESMRFWAYDSVPVPGEVYRSVVVAFHPRSAQLEIDDLCEQLLTIHELAGIEVLDAQCGQAANEQGLIPFIFINQIGPTKSIEHQYVYLRENGFWAISLTVDESELPRYTPTIETFMELIRISSQVYDRQIDALTAAIEEEPDDEHLYYSRGQTYYARNQNAFDNGDPSRDVEDFRRAVLDYTSAIEINPQDAAAFRERGWNYWLLGLSPNAIEDYQMAISIDPAEALTYYKRGLLYQRQGDHDLALEDYKRFLELTDNQEWQSWAENEIAKLEEQKSCQRDLVADNIIGDMDDQLIQLNFPTDVAVNSQGEIFLVDSRNNRILHLNSDGELLNEWGHLASIEDGEAQSGTFYEPWGIGLAPDGTNYVADTWNHRIQHFSSTGDFIEMYGYFGTGELPTAFWGPRDVVVHPEGLVIVADTGNKRLVIFNEEGSYVEQFGGYGQTLGKFDEPVGIALDDENNLYVADTWNHRIQIITPGGFTTEWPVLAWDSTSIYNKPYIALDSNGNVYVTDPENYKVIVFNATGELLYCFGSFGSDDSSFGLPIGLAYDHEGGLYVVDAGNNRLMHFVIED